MAITARRSLELLQDLNIEGYFWDQWEGAEAPAWVDQITGSPIPSDQAKEEYGVTSTAPTMAPSNGQKRPSRMTANAFEIRNQPFDAAMAIQNTDWRRDKTGRTRNVMMTQLTEKSKTHWAKLLTTLIANGSSTAGPVDGKNFFAADHFSGLYTGQKNALTASDYAELAFVNLARPTSAEFADAIYSVISQFLALVDDAGEPRNETATDFVVMVPIKWMRAARSAATLRLVSDGAKTIDNALLESGFRITIAPNARLDAAVNKFRVFRAATDGNFSPLIRQNEPIDGQEVKFDFLGLDSEYSRLNGEVMSSVECSRAVGYGDWWRAMEATCSQA